MSVCRLVTVRVALLSLSSVVGFTAFTDAGVIQMANWNMGNLPNSVADNTNLSTILGYMGTKAGRPLDVLAMIETDTASAATTTTIAQTVFGTTNYADVISTPDGGSDRTGFVYNTSTVSLISSVEVDTGLTHHIIRAHFQPIGGGAGTDFYAYSVHLKSGDASADRNSRLLEAQVLRADADTLGSANVMFVGDFNWSGANERGASPILSAYDAFSASGPGQVTDPLNQVGAWRDNPAYLSLHTNDPGGAMDDRFDMQLVSGELQDGTGLDFVPGSYDVIGNNGTHTLNGTILTGTGAPTNVLNALYNFSDHLPVMASYSYNVPEPTVLSIVIGGVLLGRRRR